MLLVSCKFLIGQTITDQQARALNNYVALANHLNKELDGLGPSMASLYSNIRIYRKYKGTRPISPYISRIDANSYYLDEASGTAGNLGSKGSALGLKVKQFTGTFQQIDKACKEIEIYFRLKDYESDKFNKTDVLLASIINLVHQYKKEIEEFDLELEKLYYTLQPFTANDPYQKTQKLMRNQLALEKTLLDRWTFNIDADNYTGWPNEAVQKHIQQADEKITELSNYIDRVKYPASSQYKSFISSIESIQKTKRNGIDGNTYQSQQSDDYSNTLYRNILNHYNNSAISFYNNFNKMAIQNGFRGLNYVTYVSLFELRTETKPINTTVTPFVDLPYGPVTVSPSASAISPAVHTSLGTYLEYINEGVRQINNLTRSMSNLNSDAARGKGRMEAGEKVSINFYRRIILNLLLIIPKVQ